jgi:hypothetical protein
MYAQVPVSSEHGESVTSNDVLAIVRTPALAVLMVGLEVVGMARALSGALATDCAAPCPTPRIGLLSLCAVTCTGIYVAIPATRSTTRIKIRTIGFFIIPAHILSFVIKVFNYTIEFLFLVEKY